MVDLLRTGEENFSHCVHAIGADFKLYTFNLFIRKGIGFTDMYYESRLGSNKHSNFFFNPL